MFSWQTLRIFAVGKLIPRRVLVAGSRPHPFHAVIVSRPTHTDASTLVSYQEERCQKHPTLKGTFMRYHTGSAIIPLVLFSITSSAVADSLEEIARRVPGKARRASSGVYDPESNRDCYHIGPGETQVLTELAGPGEIRHMWFTIAGQDRRYPRSLVLRIYWDGAEVPSVETPVGDFFAAGNGMRADVNSLPIQVTSYGRALNCYWRMPFRKNARFELTNEGSNRLSVYWQFDWMEYDNAPKDLFYFHARYRQEFPAKPFSPYVIFEGEGEGHYVGTVFSIQCSYGSWFGESDDRFYIDGEPEPSIVGTGCEDFFNDAWNLRTFTNANTGVTIKEPNGEDCRFTAYRWHIQAPVTFKKSLKVDIERRSYAAVTDPETGRQTTYDFKYRPDFCSSVAFWYQKNVARRFWAFPPVDQRINQEIFLELSEMADQITTSDGVTARRHSNRVCNLKRGLYIDNPAIGGSFEVPLQVEDNGLYSISVFQCLYKTGGIWKVTLSASDSDQSLLEKTIDFYDPFLAWDRNRPENFLYGTWFENKFGIYKLPPGEYRFRFECVGAHPLSQSADGNGPGLNCRLDGISLRRFPWDDLHGQMLEYLADEKTLFAARMNNAQEIVQQLARTVEHFHKEHGHYPEDLMQIAGDRPRELPRDPWNQQYQYVVPGRFNPDSFDLFSWHGNSRDPAVWIGNWPNPFRIAGAIEGEELSIAGTTDGVRSSIQRIGTASFPPLSQGTLRFVRLDQEGAWIEFELPQSIKPGRHQLTARYVTSRDYGILQLSLNGTPLGQAIDTFTPNVMTKRVEYGEVELKPDRNLLRITVAGRNERSTGVFAGLDAVTLTPVK